MIAQSLQSHGTTYYNMMSARLVADIDIKRLQKAWEIVVSSNLMLRTGFIPFDDHRHYGMIVYTPDFVSSSYQVKQSENVDEDVSKQFEEDRSCVASNLIRPPWRLNFFQDQKTNALTMLLTIHHAVYDARSIDLTLKYVEEAYHNQISLEREDIDNLLCYLVSQTSEETIIQQNNDFWTREFTNANFNKFPSLTISTNVKKGIPTVCNIEFDKAYESILERCRFLGVSAQAVVHVAWAKVLGAYVSETDVVFGSGRS